MENQVNYDSLTSHVSNESLITEIEKRAYKLDDKEMDRLKKLLFYKLLKFKIGDKVRNKYNGFEGVIKAINDKVYLFVDDTEYLFDNSDGFSIEEECNWVKI